MSRENFQSNMEAKAKELVDEAHEEGLGMNAERDQLLSEVAEKKAKIAEIEGQPEIDKEVGEIKKEIVSREKAEALFTSNGFEITEFVTGYYAEGYNFKMWTKHSNGFTLTIMQRTDDKMIHVYIGKNGEHFFCKVPPFTGGAGTDISPDELESLIKRIAAGEFEGKDQQ